MDNNTLDTHLVKKDIKQIYADLKKAGYRHSFLHTKGYVIVKKTNLVKVRVVLDQQKNAAVTIMPLGIKEIIFNIFILLIFIILGGLFLIIALGYVLISGISFLVYLPKMRAFKTEIENAIR